MAQTIRIKRSSGSAAPSVLANAELAYSEGGDGTLYIGVGTSGPNAASVVQIGGAAVASAITSSRSAGYVFAGPSTGANAAPSWRALVATDLPDISGTYLTVSSASSTYLSQSSASSTYAPLASPALTGTPTAPTASTNDNSTQIATTAWVKAQGYGTSSASGTVTSVALSLPNVFTVSGSPVTTSGTLSAALATQNANKLFAGPATGSDAAPTFRALVAADIPDISSTYLTTSSASSTYLPLSGGTISSNLTISGNLTVNGTTTTVNSTTVAVADKNLELAKVSSPTDATADGAGITVVGATNHTWNWLDATDAWTSSEHIDLASGKAFYINGTSVLSSSTLGSGVTSSSLTSVGTLTSGSLGAGFTTVSVAQGGTGATTLTGLIKGNGTSAFSAAVAGTDYLSPSSDIDGGSYP